MGKQLLSEQSLSALYGLSYQLRLSDTYLSNPERHLIEG